MGMMNPPSSVGYVFIDSIDGFVFLVGPTSFASPGMSELALPNNMHARRASWPHLFQGRAFPLRKGAGGRRGTQGRGTLRSHPPRMSDDRRGSYRRWLERSSTATIFVYSALIVAFFPAFHFVLGATPGVPPDSLTLRLAAAAVAAAVAIALLLAPRLRRYSPNLQLLNVLPTIVASPILVVNSGNNPSYIAGSLVLAIGVQQAFYRTRDFIIVLVTTLGVEVLYSAIRGVFFSPANLNALALTGSGFFVAMAAGILRLRVQRNERELRSIVRDRTRELSEANAKLEEMSVTDPLTGLRNRRFLAQHLEFEVAAALRRTGDVPDADLLFFSSTSTTSKRSTIPTAITPEI